MPKRHPYPLSRFQTWTRWLPRIQKALRTRLGRDWERYSRCTWSLEEFAHRDISYFIDVWQFTSETLHEFEAFVLCHGFDHFWTYGGRDHRQFTCSFRHWIRSKSIVQGISLSGLFDDLYASSARAANSVPNWSPVNLTHSSPSLQCVSPQSCDGGKLKLLTTFQRQKNDLHQDLERGHKLHLPLQLSAEQGPEQTWGMRIQRNPRWLTKAPKQN